MKSLSKSCKKVIKEHFHYKKSSIYRENLLSKEGWDALDPEGFAEEVWDKLLPILESYARIPCHHGFGSYDPMSKRRDLIEDVQKAKAFERFCKELGINPKVKSEFDCPLCSKDPLLRDKTEGATLFREGDE